ncbi:MAG: hypothetical protein ACYC3I_10565 [Gemmataceae bacterium]
MEPTSEAITPEAIAEAKRNPGGWVYAIDGRYNPKDGVPPEAIKGAWKVDESGNIVGQFIPNPNYVPDHPKVENWQFGTQSLPLTEAQKLDLQRRRTDYEANRHAGSTGEEVETCFRER